MFLLWMTAAYSQPVTECDHLVINFRYEPPPEEVVVVADWPAPRFAVHYAFDATRLTDACEGWTRLYFKMPPPTGSLGELINPLKEELRRLSDIVYGPGIPGAAKSHPHTVLRGEATFEQWLQYVDDLPELLTPDRLEARKQLLRVLKELPTLVVVSEDHPALRTPRQRRVLWGLPDHLLPVAEQVYDRRRPEETGTFAMLVPTELFERGEPVTFEAWFVHKRLKRSPSGSYTWHPDPESSVAP